MQSSNGGAPNDPVQQEPTIPDRAAVHDDSPPEGPPAAFITTDIELPAAYWDILNGKVKIRLRS